jgi:hypothetical protein
MRIRDLLIRLLVVIGILASACGTSGASSVEEQVKDLAECYKQVEDQLGRSVHYIRKTEANGETTVEQAWYNGANNLIKVSVERTGPSGRELTEFFGDFEDYNPSNFVLVRKETPLPDGGTQVDESRKYFGREDTWNGILIRELTKSARFKPGASTDTAHVPNVVVDLAKQPKENRPHSSDLEQPSVAALIEAGPPVFDPFAKVKGDSEKFRAIHDTASPDGRYAIAIGLAREKINWDEFSKDELAGEEDLRNYVVDLVKQRILGEIGCNYFSTYPRSGRNACQVKWSPDSTKFAFHQWSGKWSDICLVAGQIAAGPKLVGVVNLGKEIEKRTFPFLKKRPKFAALWWDIDRVSSDGVVQMRVDCVGAHGKEREGETLSSLSERLRLRATPDGLRAEMLNIRRLPVDYEPD